MELHLLKTELTPHRNAGGVHLELSATLGLSRMYDSLDEAQAAQVRITEALDKLCVEDEEAE